MSSGICLDPDQEAGRPVQSWQVAKLPRVPGPARRGTRCGNFRRTVDSLLKVAALPDRCHRLLPGRCRSLVTLRTTEQRSPG
eukprot:504777-Hanusia_phi.AAC.1